MTAEACQKFVDQYTSEVDSMDLKSSELERRIQQVNHSIQHIEYINRNLPEFPLGVSPLEQANRRIIESLVTTRQDLERKLEKLLAFNGSSPAIFSAVNAFYGTLAQGLQQANSGFNPSTGTFTIPQGKALDWAKTAQSTYQKNNQKKLDQLMKLPYSPENAIKIYELAQKDPSLRIDEKAVQWFREHKDDLQGLFVDFSMSTIEKTLKSNGDDLAMSIGMMFGTLSKNAPYGSWMSAANQGLTAGITSTANSAFNATTNFLGSTVKATSLGVGIGTALGLAAGDSFGQAFASSAVTTGVSLGVNALITGALTLAAVATPVGWAAVGVAVGVTAVTTILYNFDVGGMKTMAEDIGEKIDNSLTWSGNLLNETWSSLISWSW